MPRRPHSKTVLIFCALLAVAAVAAFYLYRLRLDQSVPQAPLRLILDSEETVVGTPVDWQADHLQLATSAGRLTVRLGEISAAMLPPDPPGSPRDQAGIRWSLGRSNGYVERIEGCLELLPEGEGDDTRISTAFCRADLADLERLIPEKSFAIESRSFEELRGAHVLTVHRREMSRSATPVSLEFRELLRSSVTKGRDLDSSIETPMEVFENGTTAYWETEYKTVQPRFESQPENRKVRLLYIESAVETDRLEEAREAVQQALRTSPEDPFYRYWKGVIHLLDDEPDEARHLLEEVRYDVSPTYPAVDLYLGLASSKADRLEQRCGHLRRYLASGATGEHLLEVNRLVGQIVDEQCQESAGVT